MRQQYELLRKENDLLNSLIGKSFNQKNKFEAERILKEIHSKADRLCMEKALCYVVDKEEIRGVGGSSLMQNKKTGEIESDLLLNQYGLFMASLLKGGTAIRTATMNDINNASRIINVYNTATLFNDANSLGDVELQVGSGSTAPARTDFAIETAFGTSPEDASFNSSVPVYSDVNFNFKNSGQITAGGSGTVNESIFQILWRDSTVNNRIFTMYRDTISPGVPFVASQSIFLEYTTQI